MTKTNSMEGRRRRRTTTTTTVQLYNCTTLTTITPITRRRYQKYVFLNYHHHQLPQSYSITPTIDQFVGRFVEATNPPSGTERCDWPCSPQRTLRGYEALTKGMKKKNPSIKAWESPFFSGGFSKDRFGPQMVVWNHQIFRSFSQVFAACYPMTSPPCFWKLDFFQPPWWGTRNLLKQVVALQKDTSC